MSIDHCSGHRSSNHRTEVDRAISSRLTDVAAAAVESHGLI